VPQWRRTRSCVSADRDLSRWLLERHTRSLRRRVTDSCFRRPGASSSSPPGAVSAGPLARILLAPDMARARYPRNSGDSSWTAGDSQCRRSRADARDLPFARCRAGRDVRSWTRSWRTGGARPRAG
jgi:hypothetical protein